MGVIVAVAGRSEPALLLPRLIPLLLLSLLSSHEAVASTNSEILRSKAIFAYVDKGYTEALNLLDQALADDSRDHLSHYYRGLSNARLGRYRDALHDLAQAYQAGVNRDGLLYEMGMANYRLGEQKEAVVWLQRAVAQSPDHRPSSYYLGVAQFRLQHYVEAIAPLAVAGKIGDDMGAAANYLRAEALYHLGRRQEGREVLQQLIRQEGSTRFFDYHLYPYSSLWQGDEAEAGRSKALFAAAGLELDTAKGLLDEAIIANGDDPYARYYRGVIQARRGDYDGAQEDLNRAAEVGFEHRELMYEMGYVAYRQGNYDSAVTLLEHALSQEPQNDRSNYLLGLSQQQRKEYPKALAALERVSPGGELRDAADYARAEILVQLRRDDEARAILQRLMAKPDGGVIAQKAKSLYQRVEARSGILPQGVSVEMSAGMVHDSNVALYPNDQMAISAPAGGDDNRWQLGLDLRWNPIIGGGSEAPLTVGYRLFKSYHQNLDSFDLLNHSLLADWHQKGKGLEWGVSYQYIDASLDGYDYVTTHLVTPNLMLLHGDKQVSFIKLQWRNDSYDYSGLEGYDGNRYELAYNYYWLMGGQRYLSAGLLALRNATDDEGLSHSGYGVNGAAEWDWQGMLARLALGYQRKDFPDAPGGERTDNVINLDLRLQYPLSKHLLVQVEGSRIDNRSDAAAYDYDRSLYGMTLKWKL